MILETGRANNRCGPSSRAGFTLLEIILVFALIALASSVIITNFTTFLSFDDQIDPEETLRAAIRSARFQAASERSPAILSFDKEAGALLVSGGQSFPLTADFGAKGRSAIRFYLVPPAEGMGPFPDPEGSRLETEEVSFAPDRTSTPFVAEIEAGQAPLRRLVFDPFSSLVRTGK